MADAVHAAGQAWPAFALVTGLLLVGVVAERDGLFAAAGARLSRLPLGPRALLVASFAVVALVTAVLNLDTAVLFLTPVLLHLARHRGIAEGPFLYGAVFMANAGSLFLPGSNLTNLIVLHHEHVSGATFLARTWPAAVASVATTAFVLTALSWGALGSTALSTREPVRARIGLGAPAIALSTLLVLALSAPALPVLAVGVVAAILARVTWARVLLTVDPGVIGGLFLLAVAVGSLARWWHGPARLVESFDRWQTAAAGAVAALCLNNLPASMLLSSEPPTHSRALLIGLDLGPNLAVTGSLSAVLSLRVARSHD